MVSPLNMAGADSARQFPRLLNAPNSYGKTICAESVVTIRASLDAGINLVDTRSYLINTFKSLGACELCKLA
jgi:hypothetical protein